MTPTVSTSLKLPTLSIFAPETRLKKQIDKSSETFELNLPRTKQFTDEINIEEVNEPYTPLFSFQKRSLKGKTSEDSDDSTFDG